jgi:GNAT superfamily N-acetyltransferase
MKDISDVIIRKAKSSDAAEYERIRAAGWEYAYRGIFDDKFLNKKISRFLSLEKILKTSKSLEDHEKLFLVATLKNRIIGEIGGDSSGDLALYLDPKYIGKGVGKKLFLEWAKHIGKKSDKFTFVCLTDNKSCGFYEKLGAVKIGEKTYNGKIENIYEFSVSKLQK